MVNKKYAGDLLRVVAGPYALLGVLMLYGRLSMWVMRTEVDLLLFLYLYLRYPLLGALLAAMLNLSGEAYRRRSMSFVLLLQSVVLVVLAHMPETVKVDNAHNWMLLLAGALLCLFVRVVRRKRR